MRRLLGLSLLAALAVGTLLALSAAQALGNHVQCGDVITQDTALDSDLIDCPGHGIVIGADGITIDLNGHMLSGTHHGTGVLNEGNSDVTIENGSIERFFSGVIGLHVQRNTVRAISSEAKGGFGILIGDSADNRIENNVLNDIVIAYSSSNVVANNFVDEGAIEVYGYSASGNLVASNHVSTSVSVGIIAEGYLSNVRIERNVVEGGGIILNDAFESEVQRNRLSSDGIVVASSSGVHVLDNEITGPPTPLSNGRTGGITVIVNAYNVHVARNTVSGSIDGVVVGDSTGTVLERNSLSRNDVDGIRIEADARARLRPATLCAATATTAWTCGRLGRACVAAARTGTSTSASKRSPASSTSAATAPLATATRCSA
jgi:parallel beta-helix repeat protein